MKNTVFVLSLALLICAAALLSCAVPISAQEPLRAAMLPIKTGSNINHWWSGDFDPGACMTELLNVKLANSKRFTLIDKENLAAIMEEHNLAIAGEVTAETASKIGELTGAKYFISGTVIEFSEVNTGGGSNFSLVRITDTDSRVIVASAESMKEIPVASGGGSFYIAGTGGGSEGGETSASGLGKGMEEVAVDLVAKLESANVKEIKRVVVTGYIMDVDGDQIYIGLDKPEFKDVVKKGYSFKVTREKSIKDPKSLTMRTINRPVGDLQVMSVDGDVVICKASSTSEPVQKNDKVVTK